MTGLPLRSYTGYSWSSTGNSTDTCTGTITYSYVSSQAGLGNTTVPAGTFEVFKIIAKRKGVKNIYWYSPKLKLYVKIIKKHHNAGESKIELIQYTKP